MPGALAYALSYRRRRLSRSARQGTRVEQIVLRSFESEKARRIEGITQIDAHRTHRRAVADAKTHGMHRVVEIGPGVSAVLVGGYHGTWLPAEVARSVRLDREGLADVGASLGAGVLAALPADRCGLVETARVVGYLAAESAGQCGPCLNRLPRIAAALELIARPGQLPRRLPDDVARWAGLVADRGACRHPDGTVRLVAGALRVFTAEARLHRGGRCSGSSGVPFLPTPGRAR